MLRKAYFHEQIVLAMANMLAGADTGHYWTWLTPEPRVCTAPPSYKLTILQHNLKQVAWSNISNY